MRFTIVTPTLNQAAYIDQTIASVVGQAGSFAIDYRIVDGGSTDGTLERLKWWTNRLSREDRIRFRWTSGPDAGQADAINKGFRDADGDILAFINSDDFYEPGIFQVVADRLQKNPEQLWVTGYNRIVDDKGVEIQRPVQAYKNFWLRLNRPAVLYVLNYVSQPSTFFSRAAFEAMGPFDPGLRYCMDYDFWLKLSTVSPPIVLRQVVSNFRIHPFSKGKTGFREQFIEELEVARRHCTDGRLLALHAMHNVLIAAVYRCIKRPS